MKLTKNGAALKSNAEFKSEQFKIGDMSIILELLTKLYSNPIQTLTQEYISNARDAMREANNTKDRIKITLPTSINPTLKIRDFGVGLSDDRIKNVFVHYGNSTKRNGNEMTGGFGIGAKSAWAYTDSFTVTSWHKGNKATYVCHKSSDNGNMDQVYNEPTVDNDGVEIQIAVSPHDINRFKLAVLRTIYFWDDKEKPEITNIDKSELTHEYKKFEVDNNFHIYQELPSYIYKGYGRCSLAVIDGIPYEIKNMNNPCFELTDYHCVFFFNNGEISIAPNREELIYSDYTKKGVIKKFKQAFKVTKSFIDKEFKKCKSIKETIEKWSELNENFDVDGEYKDFNLKRNQITHDEFRHKELLKGLIQTKYLDKSGKIRTEKYIYISVHHYNQGIIFYNDDNESQVKVNQRIRTALKDNDNIIFLPNELKELADDLNARKITDYERTQVEKNKKNYNEKVCLHYRTYKNQTKWLTIGELEKMSFIWIEKKEMGDNRQVYNYFTSSRNKYKFYEVSSQVAKKLRENKLGLHISRFIKRYRPNQINEINYHVNLDRNQKQMIVTLKDIPEFKVMEQYLAIERRYRYGRNLPEVLEKKKKESGEILAYYDNKGKMNDIIDKIPLLSFVDFYNLNDSAKNDIIAYVNNKLTK